MTHSPRRILVAAAIVAALALPAAIAQSLARFAPADALIVLDFDRPPELGTSLAEDLAALDWSGARDTLATLAAATQNEWADEVDFEISEMLEEFGSLGELGDELMEECPALPTDADVFHLVDEGVVTVGLSPASPFPVLTLIGRVPSDQAQDAEAVHEALVACFGSDMQTQDGTEIHILGQGSDLPLAVARWNDLYVVASTPDAVRGVLRRATGSGEPSLADASFWSETDRFEGTGFGFGVNVAAAMDLVEQFAGGAMSDDPAEAYLARRLLAVGRTLGGIALRAGATESGILVESLVAVDPDGGDAELAELLLCRTCGVSLPLLAPAGSNAVTSQHVDLRAWVAYLQDWLDGISEATGEELDLRELAREHLGIDLDTALLDWIGSEVHVVALEPFRPTLKQLAYQQPTAVIVPVASAEAAEEGLAHLGEALGPIVLELMSGSGPMLGRGLGPMDFGDVVDDLGMVAVRQATYRGVSYRRLQVGPLTDTAVALVGNHLVIASPSSAVETVIDTYLGDTASLDSPASRLARELAPPGAFAISFVDVGADLEGAAELARLLTQPAAAAISLAVSATTVEADVSATPMTATAMPIVRDIAFAEIPVEISGELTEDASNEFGEIAERYRLSGVPAGERVTVLLESEAFDTYLYLLDAEGTILDSNDDADFGRDSELTFVADGGTYVIEANSFGGGSTGPYLLTVEQGGLESLPQVDLSGVRPADLQPPVRIEGELGEADVLPGGDIGTYYALEGLASGQSVEVVLTSEAFDTYLRVVHPDGGAILAENDDHPDTSRSAVTFGATGDPVWVQVSSWGGSSTGPFALDVRVREATTAGAEAATDEPTAQEASATSDTSEPSEPVDPPSFAALLSLTEIVPETLSVLADHIGVAFGYGEVDGTVIYRRSFLEVDW